MSTAKLVVITGESGSGKTTACRRLIQYLRQKGRDVAGVITEASYQDQHKQALLVEDVFTQTRQPLAEILPVTDGPGTGKWHFHLSGVEWGNEIIQQAATHEYLIIDELGPLELQQQKGWVNGIQALRTGSYQKALVVIRPSLLTQFQSLMNDIAVEHVRITPQNRESAWTMLVAHME